MRKKDIMMQYKKTFKTLKDLNSAKEGLKLGVELSRNYETVHLDDKVYIVADEDKNGYGCIQIQPECHFFDFTGNLNQELGVKIREAAKKARENHTPEERYQESRRRVSGLIASIQNASKVEVTRA